MIESPYLWFPHLQMLNTLHESFGWDELMHNPDTRGWQAREKFSELA